MALNMNMINAFEYELDLIDVFFTENSELFSSDSLLDFRAERQSFHNRIAQAQEKSRVLQIGIIGAVKAGKSSFLNALLFNGEEVLPKAATPMTAALTKISYADTPNSIIHFYSSEDWEIITQLAEQYTNELQNRYAEYEEWYHNKCKEIDDYNLKQRDILSEKKREKPIHMTLFDFERRQFRPKVAENLAAAKELVDMISDQSILDFLGKDISVADSSQLQTYIGAKGKYTPIVNYVELQMNDIRLKDFVIVDTPGLNDPIISRGNITKTFLSKCDVAILLSPTSQFMDVSTMQLMVRSLPQAGVDEIIVIGSKLDSGLLDYPNANGQIRQVYESSIRKFKGEFERNLSTLKHSDPTAAKRLEKVELEFVSSLFHSIMVKQNKHSQLNDEENLIFNRFNERFTGFSSDVIPNMAGIVKVRRMLNAVIERKDEIINGRNENVIATLRTNIVKILDIIETDAKSSLDKLQNVQIDKLKSNYEELTDLLSRARIKLSSLFETAAQEAKKTASITLSKLQEEMSHHIHFQTKSRTHIESESVKEGFLGLKKRSIDREIKEDYAETAEIIANLNNYNARCNRIINEDFDYLINPETLSSKVKKLVIEIMHKAGGSYTEDDVLIPLNRTLAAIKVPKVTISADKYVDMLNTAYKKGYASNDEIHALSQLQMTYLQSILSDARNDLNNSVGHAEKLLMDQSIKFTDSILTKLKDQFERINSQMSEKEKYIDSYQSFLKNITEIRLRIINL